jgi:ABC-type dipeptide/oligopeptide/nickel transport system permease component
MGRRRYVLKRTLAGLFTVYVTVTANFLIFRALPGSIVTNLSRVPHASPKLAIALTREFGLDRSIWDQYWLYLWQLAHFNLGVSFANQQPVVDNLRAELVNTVPMVLLGTVFAIVVGTVTGVISAWRRGSAWDLLLVGPALAFYSMPVQWLGIMAIILLGGVLPIGGISDPFLIDPTPLQHLGDLLLHMLLPSLTLGLVIYGQYTLIVRSAMLEVLGEDYILTAKSIGYRDGRVLWLHAFRNAVLPALSLAAMSLGLVVGGAILVETVFSWPGIGAEVFEAVQRRDYPMLQGAFLVLALSVIAFNFLADLVYFKLDPRIR